MANVKCPYCPQRFPTHHGLGGHLSGPCGAKLKADKEKRKASKATRVVVNLGPTVNAKLREIAKAKTQAAIPSKLASELRSLATVHRGKAEELEKMAARVEALA